MESLQSAQANRAEKEMSKWEYATASLFIFLSGFVVVQWFYDRWRKRHVLAFPSRELIIFVMMCALLTIHLLRYYGYIE